MLFIQKRPGSTIHTFFPQAHPDAGLQLRSISHGIAEPEYEVPKIISTSHVLHLIISGQALHDQDIVRVGDLFLARSDITHRIKILPGEPLNHYWLEFDGSEAEKLIARSPFANSLVYHDLDFTSIEPLLHDAVYSEQSDFAASMTQTGLLYLLLALLPSSAHASRTPNNYVSQSMDFLRVNLHQGVTVRDAARFVGLSERYLYRLFLQEVGFTPIHYLNVCRRDRAVELLQSSTLTVTEIAEACGFSDQSYFSRFFRRELQTSPSDYRKRFAAKQKK